jgi:membrane-associated protease RseP (regulator of RpoE activity)
MTEPQASDRPRPPAPAPPPPPADRVDPPADRVDPPEAYATNGLWLAFLAAAGILLWLTLGWAWLLVIGLVAVIITLHELGHYLTARWTGMKVTEFFLGFGPKLWSFRRGETEYGIKPFPVGAYVRVIGMNNLEEVDPEDEPRSYRQQSFPKRLLVVLAGPGTHFVQALLIIFVLLAVAGVPGGTVAHGASQWVVREVTEDSAASAAGLQPGDRVLSFDGHHVSTFDDLTSLIHATEVGDEVTVVYQRDGQRHETTAEIGPRPQAQAEPEADAGTPFFGIGPAAAPNETLGVVEALVAAPRETVDVTWQAVTALGHFFSPRGLGDYADSVSEGSDQQSQPSASSGNSGDNNDDGRLLSIVGAVRIGAALAEEGWAALLMFLLSINIFVGLINLVPLLPFDGGHAAVATYERIRSRRGRPYHADVAKLMPLVYAVFMGLVVLGLTALYLDFVNPVEL